MSILNDWYPGDRALDFLLIVALGVTLLSTAAWAVARGLRREPAARHLVLVSALFCCLAMPPLAALFTASGWALVSIPLLPAEPDLTDREPARGATELGRCPGIGTRPWIGLAPRSRASLSDRIVRPRTPRIVATSRRPPRRRPACRSRRPGLLTPADRPRTSERSPRWCSPAGAAAAWSSLIRFAVGCLLIRRLRRSSSPLRGDPVRLLLEDVAAGWVPGGSRRSSSRDARRRRWRSGSAAERRPPGAADRRGQRRRDARRARARGRPHRPARPSGRAPARAGRGPLLADRARARTDPRAGPGPRGAVRQPRAPGPRRLELRRDPAAPGRAVVRARPLRAAVGILHWRGELERRIAGFLDQRRSTMTRTSRWLAAPSP